MKTSDASPICFIATHSRTERPNRTSTEMFDSKTFSASLPLVPLGVPGAAFRLQLHPDPEVLRPEPEVPGIGMLRVKHIAGFRRLPTPRAGDNPVRVAAWSARPPPLPFLAAPAQAQQELWAPERARSRLGSRTSRGLLETYRASQPGCRPRPPRRSADDYRAAGLAALCSGEHSEAALQLSTALQLRLSSTSKQQVCHLVRTPRCRSRAQQAAVGEPEPEPRAGTQTRGRTQTRTRTRARTRTWARA